MPDHLSGWSFRASFTSGLCHAAVEETDDVKEVWDCVAAIKHGMRRMRSGFPFHCRNVSSEMHEIFLMSDRRASEQPGQFYRSQKWIGGTRPVMPFSCHHRLNRLDECLSAFDRFLHADDPTSPDARRERGRADRLA